MSRSLCFAQDKANSSAAVPSLCLGGSVFARRCANVKVFFFRVFPEGLAILCKLLASIDTRRGTVVSNYQISPTRSPKQSGLTCIAQEHVGRAGKTRATNFGVVFIPSHSPPCICLDGADKKQIYRF